MPGVSGRDPGEEVSAEGLSGNQAEGVRFMLHVFYCEACPRVEKFRDVVFLGEVKPVDDFREALFAGVADPLGAWHAFCDDGFSLLMAARRRGWGT